MATGILAMLAKPKGKGGSEGPPSSKPSGDEVESAIQEFFELGKGGDYQGAALAFRRAKEACEDSYEAEEAADEEMAGAEEDELDL